MKNRTELAHYFADLGFTKGAEIGVQAGKYSKKLLDIIPNLELLCVDNWGRKYARHEPLARELLTPYGGAKIIKGLSVEVAKSIPDESLDFVYIDADHSYQSVWDDIVAWFPKIYKGGIISGHDYRPAGRKSIQVAQAVNDFVIKNKLTLLVTDWDLDNPVVDERQPSWYIQV